LCHQIASEAAGILDKDHADAVSLDTVEQCRETRPADRVGTAKRPVAFYYQWQRAAAFWRQSQRQEWSIDKPRRLTTGSNRSRIEQAGFISRAMPSRCCFTGEQFKTAPSLHGATGPVIYQGDHARSNKGY
jgi:hypothetical protein